MIRENNIWAGPVSFILWHMTGKTMPVSEHIVSNRNGSQIMVKGIQPSLGDMGYCRGAHVKVTDPGGSPAHAPWVFVVSNDEHATLVCQNPAPPAWIQVGVRIRIDVRPPAGVGPAVVGGQGGVAQAVPVAQPVLPNAPTTSTAQAAARLAKRGRLFDVYLFIDWSATNGRANAPGPDQLWLGELLTGTQPREEWFQSRVDCGRHVEERILHHVASRRRVLVGFDFAYGYPAGLVKAAGLPAPAGQWLAVWTALSALLNDDEQNRSN